jgi:Xaa-Pro aminopeptidase
MKGAQSSAVKKRVQALRAKMREHCIQAYLIPSSDPHQSEYVPQCWQRRPWISGFNGSMGDVLITLDEAGLWADGRYFLQAADQLKGSGIKLYKMAQPGVPTINEFLEKKLKKGQALGIDPQTVSMRRAREIEQSLRAAGAGLKSLSENLVDAIWADRPNLPADQVMALSTRFTGESVSAKLARVRKEMKARSADAHFISALDGVAWLLNLRGRDVPYNPVLISYALVTAKTAILFIDPAKVPSAIAQSLAKWVEFRPYANVAAALESLGREKQRVWVDDGSVSRWAADLLSGADLVTDISPITLMKARKNNVEIRGMREAHVRDGAAMCRFLSWLDSTIGTTKITEISAADKLEAFRCTGQHFQGLSFNTISGYADHGAIIHYSVSPETDVPLRAAGIYLIDSGAQYLDGTTDITRTVLLGKKATPEQKDRFTRVLQGHIRLARVRFPQGVTGGRLDVLARTALWNIGLDYNHGTGHGVGSFLNVHEGPRTISSAKDTGLPIEAGNIFSNEPGYYKPGGYGIRLENLVLVKQNGVSGENGLPYYEFETLTLCPIDTRLVDVKLLDSTEREWLNAYHKEVFAKLSPLLDSSERAWLKRACAPVGN